MTTRHLITGGAGFIGRHLSAALLAAGDAVVILDDGSTGLPEQVPVGVRAFQGSVCDAAVVAEAMAGCDQVWHLAAAVGVQYVLEQRVRGITTNIRGTEVVLEQAVAAGGLPVFLASSSEVYGRGVAIPFAEDDDLRLGPTLLHRWSYACAKALDEFLALAWHHEQGLPVRIARFFNVTGPGQLAAYGMVLPRFCRAALADEELLVHGDGEQSRCFLHIDDAIAAMRALVATPASIGQVVNIGSNEEVTIGNLADQVIARAGSGRRQHLPYSDAFPGGGFEDMHRRVPDLSRLQTLTGWCRQRSLNAIIDDCLKEMR